MEYTITQIEGDGIGPEIASVARECIEATGTKIKWRIYPGTLKKNMLPQDAIQSIEHTKVGLKGPLSTPIGEGHRSINVMLRQLFDLYLNIRPAKSLPKIASHYKDIDLIVCRENTEDVYVGIEFEEGARETKKLIKFLQDIAEPAKILRGDSSIGIKPISVGGSQRFLRASFEYAAKKKRKKVTIVHKANIMKFTDGLFLRIGREIGASYPAIEVEEKIVDNMCMQLVQKPEDYDVLVMPNLYGDILSDLCAGLIGGLGLAPSANIGEKYAIFEPVHGSAPKYAGKNTVNPTAMILSGAMMLEHLGEYSASRRIENAVIQTLKKGKSLTLDIAQNKEKAVGTVEMGQAIIKEMRTR